MLNPPLLYCRIPSPFCFYSWLRLNKLMSEHSGNTHVYGPIPQTMKYCVLYILEKGNIKLITDYIITLITDAVVLNDSLNKEAQFGS